jgi:hypothetical protein
MRATAPPSTRLCGEVPACASFYKEFPGKLLMNKLFLSAFAREGIHKSAFGSFPTVTAG